MGRVFCMIPGCNRSSVTWRNQDNKGRKPFAFRSSLSPSNMKWKAWGQLMEQLTGVRHEYISICDIHFTMEDFYPTYTKRKAVKDPIPDHLLCVSLKKDAVPSLYLDQSENFLLQLEAKKKGEYDWWRLSEKYDAEQDLDQLVKFNKPVYYTPIIVRDTSAEYVAHVELFNETTNLLQPTDDVSVMYVESQEDVDPQVNVEVPTKEEIDREEQRKKRLRLFRVICTCPLKLPKHWAVHPYMEDNYVNICKVSFSQTEGFVVEKALRILVDMTYPDVHCRHSDISQLMQGRELRSVQDVEQLVEQIDKW